MKKLTVLFILLILLSNIRVVNPIPNPVGVAGYVWLNGSPAPVGINITVKNEDSGEYANTTTVSHDGYTMYATSIYAEDGDTIVVSCNYSGYYAYNFTVVNLSLVTQWCNITLGEEGNPPFAFFTYSPKNPYVGDKVRFYDSSYDVDGWIVYRTWNFGDGKISHEKNPTHVFTEAGTYKVKLTVKDNDGLTSTAYRNVVVKAKEGEEEENVVIPPMPPPKYPEEPNTVPEMYEMLKLPDKVVNSKVKIVVIDTGFTPRVYEDPENNISVDMNDIIGRGVGIYDAFDGNGHGSWCNYAVHWVLENYMPNAVQYSIRAFSDDGTATQADILEALKLAEKLGANVISCSWGYFGNTDDVISRKVRDLRSKGIVVVCAGGNYGPAPNTITVPATSPYTIAVGAVDPVKTIDIVSDDVVTNWSSRGPVYGLREVKPDIVAGGESIKGPWLNGEKVASGTSMATPIVAGSCAYMVAKEKRLFDLVKLLYFWNKGKAVDILERSIERTAREPLEGDVFDYGNGVPDIESAIKVFHDNLWWSVVKILIVYAVIILTVIFLIIRYFVKKRKEQKYT